MKTKSVMTWLIAIAGEALIVAAFLMFFSDLLPSDVLVLDVFVASVVYWLFFIDLIKPWTPKNDPPQKRASSLGVRWFFTILYDIAAIAAMIFFAVVLLPFKVQLLVQLALLLFVLLGLLLASRTAARTQKIWQDEQQQRAGREDMMKILQELKSAAEISGTPQSVVDEIASLCDEVRYISPANTNEAANLESQFVESARQIQFAFREYNMNKDAIANQLAKCKRILQQRKSIYSN